MSGLFGLGRSRNAQPNRYGSILLPSSEYGVVIPVVYGTNKVEVKLADFVDFKSVPQTAGGKGGGGGVSSYEYYATLLMLLCEGPTDGIGNVYDETGGSSLFGATETYTIPSGGGSYNVANFGLGYYYDEGCTFPSPYSFSANDYGSDQSNTFTGVNVIGLQKIGSGTPAANQYIVTSLSGTYQFSAADAGKTVTIHYAYQPNAVTSNQNPAQLLNLTQFKGQPGQTAWGYMTSNHPERALAYQNRLLIGNLNMDLGSDPQVPSLTCEVLNGQQLQAPGNNDVYASAVLNHILTDTRVGVNWQHVGDLSLFTSFCKAAGILVSPLYDNATSLSSVLQDLCDLSVATPIYSQGQLKVIPRADGTLVGGGTTYTPPTQPLYDLYDVDFIQTSKKKEALYSEWAELTDNYNHYFLEYGDRSMSYNTNIVEDKDDASIYLYGIRNGGTKSFHHITSLTTAQTVLSLILGDTAFPKKNWYFKLPSYYALLDLMDVVTLTSPSKNLVKVPVRIQKCVEDSVGNLDITAQDFCYSSVQPAVYGQQPGSGTPKGGFNSPGNVNTPILFEAIGRISESGYDELWMGISGASTSWGGCDIYLSSDNVNYIKIGTQKGNARMGASTAAFAVGSDPDTTNTLSVDLTESSAQLLSGVQADADNYNTLCWIDGELISYETATLTAKYKYNLTTYLRRGIFGSGIAAHASGSPFLRIDSQVFKYEYDISLIGKTVYLKFLSFNVYNQLLQGLSDVSPYTILLTGKFSTSNPNALNNMTITSTFTTGATTATINIFESGASVGTAGLFFLPNGAQIPGPAYSSSGFTFDCIYYVNFNPSTNGYIFYKDPVAASNDLSQYGYIAVGSITTTTSTGTTGTGAGGGTGGGGGSAPVKNPTCFASGTDYCTNLGNMNNIDIFNAWRRDPASVLLKSRSGFEKIKKLSWHEVSEIYLVHIAGRRMFECSESTPFSLGCNKYVCARDLVRDMMIETTLGLFPVKGVVKVQKMTPVLLVELEGPSHEYIAVGCVWSHNAYKVNEA